MKTLTVVIALVMACAGIVSANGVTNRMADHTAFHSLSSVTHGSMDSILTEDVLRSHFDTVMNEDGGDDDPGSCADDMDDLCAD